MEGHLPGTGHRRRHGLPGTSAPFQKPCGIVHCKRLILRRRNRLVSPFQKQVIMEGQQPNRRVVTRLRATDVLITALASAIAATLRPPVAVREVLLAVPHTCVSPSTSTCNSQHPESQLVERPCEYADLGKAGHAVLSPRSILDLNTPYQW